MSDIINKWIGTAQVDSRVINPSDSSYVVAGFRDTGDMTVQGRSLFLSDSTFSKIITSRFDSTSRSEFLKPVLMDMDSTVAGKFLVQGTFNANQDATVGTLLRAPVVIANTSVGVGTTSPADRVTVLGAVSDATARVTVASLNTAGTSMFAIGQVPDVRLAHRDATSLFSPTHYTELMNVDNVPFILGTGGVERIRFTENNPPVNFGYIGIGTTRATSQVDVYGLSPINNASGQLELHGMLATDGTIIDRGAGILFEGHDGSNERSWGTIQMLKENASGGNWNAYARISVRNNPLGVVERVRITSVGYVGIGTSGPVTLVQAHNQGLALPYSGSAMSFTDTTTGVSSGLRVGIDASQIAYVNNLRSSSLYFSTGNVERMRIDSAGNVGIGTTSPALPLSVVGNPIGTIRMQTSPGTAPRLDIVQVGIKQWGIVNPASTIRLSIIEDGADERMTFLSGGNVGIGTTVPNASLDVNGLVQIRGGSPAAGYVLTSDATGLASWQINQSGWAHGVGSVYTVTSTDNVGIGTTTPQVALDVLYATASVRIKSIGTTTSFLTFSNTVITDSQALLIGRDGISGGSLATGSSSYAGVLASWGGYPLQFATGNTATVRMAIDSTGLVDIYGQVRIRGGSPVSGAVLTSDASGFASWGTGSGWTSDGTALYSTLPVNVASAGTPDASTGITWTARTGVAGTWRSVCFGNGLFVAVSSSQVMTSLDGITWTSQTGVAGTWSVCYGNGLFVAVKQSPTYVMTSPDGITWTSQTGVAGNWLSVCYGNGLFVAVSNSSSVMTSPDGITWTSQTGVAGTWTSVCYGNGLFVAVSPSSSYVMTSPNGITWTSRTGIASTWTSVCYGNGLFVAVSDSSSPYVMTSPDGITWTSQTGISGNWLSVCYGNGLFVAVKQASTYVMTSPDGITWTARTGISGNWLSVCYGNGLFVAVKAASSYVMTSGTILINLNINLGASGISLTSNPFVLAKILIGIGVPVVTAPNGSLFLRTDGTGPNLYVRQNGSWVSK